MGKMARQVVVTQHITLDGVVENNGNYLHDVILLRYRLTHRA